MTPKEVIEQLKYIKKFHLKNKKGIYALNLAILYLERHFAIKEVEK